MKQELNQKKKQWNWMNRLSCHSKKNPPFTFTGTHTYVNSENTDVQAEIESLNEIRKLVSLGSLAQPNICLYTFHHTQDQ